jgi:hypothetical protein
VINRLPSQEWKTLIEAMLLSRFPGIVFENKNPKLKHDIDFTSELTFTHFVEVLKEMEIPNEY